VREAQKKTISGIEVTITPFPAMEALKIQALLLRLLGPALGRAAGALDNLKGAAKNLGEIRIDGEGLAGAIAELSDKLGEDQFMAILRRLLKGVQCLTTSPDGRALVVDFGDDKVFENALDLVFGGQTMAIYPVIVFVLQVNYPDFFKVLGTGGLLGTILTSKKAAGSDNSSSKGSDSSGT
jgi:hypothetical protein